MLLGRSVFSECHFIQFVWCCLVLIVSCEFCKLHLSKHTDSIRQSKMDLKIVSYNVNGMRDLAKRKAIYRVMKNLKADIIMLQETYSTKDKEIVWATEWGGKVHFAHGDSRSCGVAIFFQRHLQARVTETILDPQGRYVILNIEYEGSNYTVSSVYGPNQDRPEFFRDYFRKVEEVQNDFKVLAGDFNLVLDNEKDRKGPIPHANKNAAKLVNQYLETQNMIDIWRVQHQEEFRFTYRARNVNYSLMERLDYILISDTLRQYVVKTDIHAAVVSDHSIPIIQLSPMTTQRGRGYWKHNVSLMKNQEYNEQVRAIIQDEISSNHSSIFLNWEMIKLKVRGFSIQYATGKKKEKNKKRDELQKQLNTLEQKLSTAEPEKQLDTEAEIARVKFQIQEIDQEYTNFASVRNKANWLQGGERNSKYFFAMEKARYNRKCISRLSMPDGEISSNLKEILNEQKTFYKQLYDIREQLYEGGTFAYLQRIDNQDTVRVRQQDRMVLEQEISKEEIWKAVQGLNAQKTPGIDGYGIEFFRTYWEELGDFMLELFQEIVRVKKLPLSARRSLISLMLKPEKDPLFLENWRPLNLLNTDYKIYAKVLANRMQLVLPYLIQPYQYGFLKGRYIGENISELISIIEHCKEENIAGLLISYDFKKAYDSVNYQALQEVLKFYEFGPHFCEMVQILHTDRTAFVLNNNHWSEEIDLKRGLSQGCPASCGLFLILTQALGEAITQNKQIRGITVRNAEKKLSQYADDLWTPMLFEQESISQMFRELTDFGQVTGLLLNYEKTNILRLGAIRDTRLKLYVHRRIRWTNEPVTVLGIDVTPNLNAIRKINYEKVANKMKATLDVWRNRKLTWRGRVILVNTLASSLAVYKMMALGTPTDEIFKSFKDIIMDFVWEGAVPKIKYAKLIQPLAAGGLNLHDMEAKFFSLKVIWVKKLLMSNPNSSFASMAYASLPLDDQRIWDSNISPGDIRANFVSAQWIDIWHAWAMINFNDPTTKENVLDQIIWYNSHVKMAGRVLCFRSWIQKGIWSLRAIFNEVENRFMGFQEASQLFGDFTDPLTYLGVIHAVPAEWKRLLREDRAQDVRDKRPSEIVIQKSKPSAWAYKLLIQRRDSQADAVQQLWAREFQMQVEELDWQKALLTPFVVSCSAKLRHFQYRLLHRKLTANVLLSKWKQDQSPLCSFCQARPETVLHMLWYCPKISALWKALERWARYILKVDLQLDPETIVFNLARGRHSWLQNTIILATKQFIYRAKCMRFVPKLPALLAELNWLEKIEKVVAIRNKKEEKHLKKWGPFIDY